MSENVGARGRGDPFIVDSLVMEVRQGTTTVAIYNLVLEHPA